MAELEPGTGRVIGGLIYSLCSVECVLHMSIMYLYEEVIVIVLTCSISTVHS